MVDEGLQHALQLSSVGDRQPVQTIAAHRADKALGDRVGFGGVERRPDAPAVLAAEDHVEGVAKLGVVVANQEAHARLAVLQAAAEVSRLLCDPVPVWILGDPGEVQASAQELDEEEHVDPSQGDRVDGEEVAGERALGLMRMNSLQEGTSRSGRTDPGSGEDPPHAGGRAREATVRRAASAE